MTSYQVLTILSGIVIFSYLLDLFARRSQVPSVLLLLFLGIGLQYVIGYFEIRTIDFLRILPSLGTIGLILIVLEGALELRYDKSKRLMIKRSFLASVVLLVVVVFGITGMFLLITHQPFYSCFLNAIPFSIISSAIAIPSVANLLRENKEFVVYESSFSDILGIVMFDFALYNTEFTASSFVGLGFDMVLILLLSAVFCLFLLFLMGRITHQVKFFLILAILILMYAIGKQFHLSSLIFVLAFGLFLCNADQLKFPWFQKHLIYPKLHNDLHQLYNFSAESAFLLRTYFFIIFGYIIDVQSILHLDVLLNGFMIVSLIFLSRYIYLRFISGIKNGPVPFISPRGLISILLFFSIPDEYRIPEVTNGLLFVVILSTGMVMAYGLFRYRKENNITDLPKAI